MKINMLSIALGLASLAIGVVNANLGLHAAEDVDLTTFTTLTTTECAEVLASISLHSLSFSLSNYQSTLMHHTAFTTAGPLRSVSNAKESTTAIEQPSVFSTVAPTTTINEKSTVVTAVTAPGSTVSGTTIVPTSNVSSTAIVPASDVSGTLILSTSGNDAVSATSIPSTILEVTTTSSVSDNVGPSSATFAELPVTTMTNALSNANPTTGMPLINPLQPSVTQSELFHTEVPEVAQIPPVTDGAPPVTTASSPSATSGVHLIGIPTLRSTSTTTSTSTVTNFDTTEVTIMVNPTSTSVESFTEPCISTVYVTIQPPCPSAPYPSVATINTPVTKLNTANVTIVATTGVPVPTYNATTPNNTAPINGGVPTFSATPALVLALCGLIGYLV